MSCVVKSPGIGADWRIIAMDMGDVWHLLTYIVPLCLRVVSRHVACCQGDAPRTSAQAAGSLAQGRQ